MSSLWSKTVGTSSPSFQFGLGGPLAQNNGGALEARNAANSAFVIVRGLTPVAANDLATKAYVDSGGVSGAIQEIRFALGTGASQSSVNQIPANAIVARTKVIVTTAFSAGATLTVGQTGTPALLQATTDNLLTQAIVGGQPNIFEVEGDTSWGAAPLAVLATVAGAPSVGAGFIAVEFSETLP